MTANNQDYEIIQYDNTNFRLLIVSVDDFPLHVHRELELTLILYGDCEAECLGEKLTLHPGDFWINSSMRSHANRSLSPNHRTILLHLQIPPEFFTQYYPDMEILEFPFQPLNREYLGEERYREMVRIVLDMAESYFRRQPHYQLKTAGLINLFFYRLLPAIPFEKKSREERELHAQRILRLRGILDYIDAHYREPLYLTDLAEQNNLSMSRLSHIFKESLGIPFQSYLSQVRCRNARQLLETTDRKLLDISMECGFSDVKYFNRDFRALFHMTPSEYRKYHREHGSVRSDQLSVSDFSQLMSSGITIFIPDDSLYILEYCQSEDLLNIRDTGSFCP